MTSRSPDAAPCSVAIARIAAVGDVIAAKYQVQQILGRGGMGVVVAALHIHLRERVALKILLPANSTDRESRARFLREARITARLQNEHIAKVMDVGMLDTGSPYFVMECLEGANLKQVLASQGPMEIPVAVNYVAQACEGIAEAHARSILHRDLKPSNLFLTKRYDGSELIKVLDFGVSKACALGPSEDSYQTEAGVVLGSPAYMSPERLMDQEVVDERADVWSLAVILYELMTGRPPFWDASQAAICAEVLAWKPPPQVRERRPDVPQALEAAIARALARDVQMRTPTVAELVAEMLAAVPDDPRATAGISLQRIRATLAQAPPSRRSKEAGNRFFADVERTDNGGEDIPTIKEMRAAPASDPSEKGAAKKPKSVRGFWHPLGVKKVILIVVLAQIVFQPLVAVIFVSLGLAAKTGASAGAGLGGALAVLVVMQLAKKATASKTVEPSETK